MKEEKKPSMIPMYDNILVTALKPSLEDSKIVTSTLQEYLLEQRVLIKGEQCPHYIMEDDIVVLNIKNWLVKKYNENSIKADINGNYDIAINYPIVEIEKEDYMLITPRDILYIIPVNKAHFTAEQLAKMQGIITGTPVVGLGGV